MVFSIFFFFFVKALVSSSLKGEGGGRICLLIMCGNADEKIYENPIFINM